MFSLPVCSYTLARPSSIERGCILFDHLVGAGEKWWRHSEAERPAKKKAPPERGLGLGEFQQPALCQLDAALVWRSPKTGTPPQAVKGQPLSGARGGGASPRALFT